MTGTAVLVMYTVLFLSFPIFHHRHCCFGHVHCFVFLFPYISPQALLFWSCTLFCFCLSVYFTTDTAVLVMYTVLFFSFPIFHHRHFCFGHVHYFVFLCSGHIATVTTSVRYTFLSFSFHDTSHTTGAAVLVMYTTFSFSVQDISITAVTAPVRYTVLSFFSMTVLLPQ